MFSAVICTIILFSPSPLTCMPCFSFLSPSYTLAYAAPCLGGWHAAASPLSPSYWLQNCLGSSQPTLIMHMHRLECKPAHRKEQKESAPGRRRYRLVGGMPCRRGRYTWRCGKYEHYRGQYKHGCRDAAKSLLLCDVTVSSSWFGESATAGTLESAQRCGRQLSGAARRRHVSRGAPIAPLCSRRY